jgi:hypothetical protein
MKRRIWLEAQEDTPFMYSDRIVNVDNTVIVTSDISSISIKVFDVDTATPDTAIVSTSVGTTCVYARLQTDGHWKDDYGNFVDTLGYNFRHLIPATAFPRDSRHVRVEYTFTPSTGDAFPIPQEFSVRRIHGS